MQVRFEHIAIAVHEEEFAAWDRLLRGPLGGREGLGGDAEGLGFRGVQVPYPCGGMLEVVSWTVPRDPASPIVRYVERFGPRAALHHLTFVVDSIDAARERCRELGYDFMQGRDGEHWKEIYLRAPFFAPSKMLIQVLEADKETLLARAGGAHRAVLADLDVAPAAEPARIVGARIACSDRDAATALFRTLLAARVEGDTLTWDGSSMRVELIVGGGAEDSHVVVEPPAAATPLGGSDVPATARRLLRAPVHPATPR